MVCFFIQAEDGIRDLVRSRGLGDVYKRQGEGGDVGRLRSRAEDVHVNRARLLPLRPEVVDGLSLIHI